MTFEKKLPQVIHVWLSEFPFHEILYLAFYSFLYKKCISCKVTFEVAIFVKKKLMPKMNRDQLQQHHFFCPSLMKMEKRPKQPIASFWPYFWWIVDRACNAKRSEMTSIITIPKTLLFWQKKHVFSTISSVASTSSIHSIVIGCLLFVRFWPTFCKHMLLPKIVQLQKKELDEFLLRFAEIKYLPIRIHE